MKYLIIIALALASCTKTTVDVCETKTKYQVTHKTLLKPNGKLLIAAPESSPLFGQHDMQMSEMTVEMTDTAYFISQLMSNGWHTGHSPMTWDGCTPATVGCYTVHEFTDEYISWYQQGTLITSFLVKL